MNSDEQPGGAHHVRDRHLQMLSAAGLIPILLPATLPLAQLEELIVLAEAVYLPGGDYHPSSAAESAGQSHQAATALGLPWDPLKIKLDRMLLHVAWRRFLPTLAVCGGFQSMIVLDGGTLRAATAAELAVHAEQKKNEQLTLDSNTLAGQIFGDKAQTNSFHRQVVAEPGLELVVSAQASDGVIEAVEAQATDHPFWLGLQWHPELLDDQRPYEALAAAARARDQGDYDQLILAGKSRFEWLAASE